jgi:hypothetical protein
LLSYVFVTIKENVVVALQLQHACEAVVSELTCLNTQIVCSL